MSGRGSRRTGSQKSSPMSGPSPSGRSGGHSDYEEGTGELEDIETFLHRLGRQGQRARRDEHERFVAKELSIYQFTQHMEKNRTRSVVLYDQSRVKLRTVLAHPSKNFSDYIHASWVNGKEYILTQAPMTNTLPDFWHLIVQESVAVVVDLCMPEEKELVPYMPRDNKKVLKIGRIKVQGREAKATGGIQDKDYKIREVDVEWKDAEGQKKALHLTHLNFVSWPQGDLPRRGGGVLRLLESVVEAGQAIQTLRGTRRCPPILILCTDGAERSGTLAALGMILKEYQTSGRVQVCEAVRAVRIARHRAIDSVRHYDWLYGRLIDWAIRRKELDPSDPLVAAKRSAFP